MDTDAKGGNESSYFMIEKLMNKRRRRPSSKLLLNTFPLSPSYYSSVRPQGFRERESVYRLVVWGVWRSWDTKSRHTEEEPKSGA